MVSVTSPKSTSHLAVKLYPFFDADRVSPENYRDNSTAALVGN